MANPYGMDEACTRCPELVETRERIVHGYGDVDAEFVFVAERPSAAADETGIPVDPPDGQLHRLLETCGFLRTETDPAGEPVLVNGFVTHLTRCRHPDRRPTDREISDCEPFLNAELRTINPEILVPLGERVLRSLAMEYTTEPPDSLHIDDVHATELRGRGFELIPLAAPETMNDRQFAGAVERFESTRDRDYRQTKGRRNR